MGKSPLKIRVLKVVEVVGKDGASDLYEVVQHNQDIHRVLFTTK